MGQQNGNRVIRIMFLVFTAVSVGLLIAMIHQHIAQSNYQKVDAVITNIQTYSHDNSKVNSKSYTLTYSYTWWGENYISKLEERLPKGKYVGDHVILVIDPNNPRNVDNGSQFRGWLIAFIVLSAFSTVLFFGSFPRRAEGAQTIR